MHGDTSDFHEDIIKEYSKLMDGGGYELLWTLDGNSKYLNVMPSISGGYTASYLKKIMQIFLRPLQRALSIEPVILDDNV